MLNDIHINLFLSSLQFFISMSIFFFSTETCFIAVNGTLVEYKVK